MAVLPLNAFASEKDKNIMKLTVLEEYQVITDPVEIEKNAKEVKEKAKINGKDIMTKSFKQKVKKLKDEETGLEITVYREDIIAYVPLNFEHVNSSSEVSIQATDCPSGGSYCEDNKDPASAAKVWLSTKYQEYKKDGKTYIKTDYWEYKYDKLDSTVSILDPKFMAMAQSFDINGKWIYDHFEGALTTSWKKTILPWNGVYLETTEVTGQMAQSRLTVKRGSYQYELSLVKKFGLASIS